MVQQRPQQADSEARTEAVYYEAGMFSLDLDNQTTSNLNWDVGLRFSGLSLDVWSGGVWSELECPV